MPRFSFGYIATSSEDIHMKKILILIAFLFSMQPLSAQLKVLFPAGDGLDVTADWYPVSSNLPVILLCHQDKSSRGEYIETALRLNKFGFNCMAVDQRVGESVNNITNETAAEAKSKHQNPKFEDAEKDIIAAIDFLYLKYKKPIIIVGSSYSASLALKIAAENNRVMAAAVFSPEEVFTDKNYIGNSIKTLMKPVFATSSKAEANTVTELLKDVNSRLKIQYIPTSLGEHGSKVLWPSTPGNQEYWIAFMSYLDKLKKMSNQ